MSRPLEGLRLSVGSAQERGLNDEFNGRVARPIWRTCDHLAVTQLVSSRRLAHLLRPGKFAEQLAGRLRMSGVGGLRGCELAEMVLSAIFGNGRPPLPLVWRYAL